MLNTQNHKTNWIKTVILLTACALGLSTIAFAQPDWEEPAESKKAIVAKDSIKTDNQVSNAISSSTNIRCTESWLPDTRDPRLPDFKFCYLHVVECVDTRTGIQVSVDFKKECFDKPVHGKIECEPPRYPGKPWDSCEEKAANNSMMCAQSADCVHLQALWNCTEQSGQARSDCFAAADFAFLEAMRGCASKFQNDMAQCKPQDDDPRQHCLRTADRTCQLWREGCYSVPKRTREQCFTDAQAECDRTREACYSKTVGD